MTVSLVTFSDDSMSRSAELCYLSARTKGGIERAYRFTPDSVKRLPYYEKHRKVFDAPRGCGYWAFKPALLHKLLSADSFVFDVRENDTLIYADAGVEFINSVNYIIDRMDQDIFLFGNMWEHAHWCKRDIIEEVWGLPAWDDPYIDYSPRTGGELLRDDNGDLSWDNFGKQVQASVIFFRVNDKTRAFVKEWLDWCLFEGGRLIDDSPSRLPNHPEFKENRHDQAILTTLAYREGYKLHAWPASYNDGAFQYPRDGYEGDNYPCLFNHHRRRNHEWVNAA